MDQAPPAIPDAVDQHQENAIRELAEAMTQIAEEQTYLSERLMALSVMVQQGQKSLSEKIAADDAKEASTIEALRHLKEVIKTNKDRRAAPAT